MPAEREPGERRVALSPGGVRTLTGNGLSVLVQAGAGAAAGYRDEAYREAGAALAERSADVYSKADVLLKVSGPRDGLYDADSEVASLREGAVLVSLLFPLSNLVTVQRLAKQRVTAFGMDLIPRVSRAQSMDALSSMSTIGGYKAALLAASTLPKFFPMLMTAAGSIPPARVLVIGAGVAGLQAVATCKRLGAVVEAFDVRPAVKEQVESLGARFVDLGLSAEEAEDAGGYAKEVSTDTHARELAVISERLEKADVVITTALVPGRPAPVLITEEMVKAMPSGALIVDLAATNGGNCELTQPGATVARYGITIMGPVDLPSTMAVHASQMYSKNICAFLEHLVKDGAVLLDLEDEVIRAPLVTHEGRVMHEPTRLAIERGVS